MLPYAIVSMLLLVGAALGLDGQSRYGARPSVALVAMAIILVVFVGLRHNVGMDWNNYVIIMNTVSKLEFWRALNQTEPGYALILLFGAETDLGIYTANLLTAALCVTALVIWARKTPEPWLALVAAFPFFILVFLMSANRQGAAASAIMIVLAYWYRLGTIGRVVGILICACFHFSALIFLALVSVDLRLSPVLRRAGMVVVAIGALFFLQQSESGIWYATTYGAGAEGAGDSSGAFFHIALNAIPASLYFLAPQWRPVLFPAPILRYLAFAALAMLPIALVASTAASRLNFYWTPMTMYVVAALPTVLAARSKTLFRVFGSTLILAVGPVWLLTANSSRAYLPYQSLFDISVYERETGLY